jgi:hypothetical protein
MYSNNLAKWILLGDCTLIEWGHIGRGHMVENPARQCKAVLFLRSYIVTLLAPRQIDGLTLQAFGNRHVQEPKRGGTERREIHLSMVDPWRNVGANREEESLRSVIARAPS